VTSNARFLLFAVCLNVVFEGGARLHAAEVTLTAVADTSLWQRETNHNLGGAPFLPAGTVGSDGNFRKTHLLLRFDLVSALPHGAVVESASIYLRVVRAPDPAKLSRNSRFVGRRILKDWGEGDKDYTDPQTPMTSTLPATAGEATWAHRFHGDDATVWGVPGGDFTDNDFAEAGDFEFFTSQLPDQDEIAQLNAEGVRTLNDWLSDPESNYGWVIRSEITSGGTARHFASREFSEPQYCPQLIIVYSLPGPRILSVARDGGTVTVDYTALAGTVYRPQWKALLDVAGWLDLPDQGPLAEDGVLQFNDDVTGADERYYRVIIP